MVRSLSRCSKSRNSSLWRGAGHSIRARENWRAAAKIDMGPLFRVTNRHGQVLISGSRAKLLVKPYVWWLVHGVEDFARHSLRAGLATSVVAAGKSERALMNQTGHSSLKTVPARPSVRQKSCVYRGSTPLRSESRPHLLDDFTVKRSINPYFGSRK